MVKTSKLAVSNCCFSWSVGFSISWLLCFTVWRSERSLYFGVKKNGIGSISHYCFCCAVCGVRTFGEPYQSNIYPISWNIIHGSYLIDEHRVMIMELFSSCMQLIMDVSWMNHEWLSVGSQLGTSVDIPRLRYSQVKLEQVLWFFFQLLLRNQTSIFLSYWVLGRLIRT